MCVRGRGAVSNSAVSSILVSVLLSFSQLHGVQLLIDLRKFLPSNACVCRFLRRVQLYLALSLIIERKGRVGRLGTFHRAVQGLAEEPRACERHEPEINAN